MAIISLKAAVVAVQVTRAPSRNQTLAVVAARLRQEKQSLSQNLALVVSSCVDEKSSV